MRYFLDTEFAERPCTIDLLSLALVSEDGLEELYVVSVDFDYSLANDFVRENVIPNLRHPDSPHQKDFQPGRPTKGVPHLTRKEIREDILKFVGDDPRPEFWGYYADFDWVVFCWLFGSMIDLPKGWPMYCRDLKQWADQLGVKREHPHASQDTLHAFEQAIGRPEPEHNALADARWERKLHNYLSIDGRPV